MSTILSQEEFYKILKKIRNTARELEEGMDFTQLKGFFEGHSITPEQADELWAFLDRQMILVAHIDEDDPLFAMIPEAEPAEEAENPAPQPGAKVKQDVSHVNSDSVAIVTELIRRELERQESEEDLANYEYAASAGARKLAAKVRPMEMRALVYFWGLDGNPALESNDLKALTGYTHADMDAIITKVQEFLPDRVGTYRKKKSFWDLFRK